MSWKKGIESFPEMDRIRTLKTLLLKKPTSGLMVFIGLALTLIGVIIVYTPGLTGPFVFDDAINITEKPKIALVKFNLPDLVSATKANDTGLFHRPLASLSFAINHYFAGGFTNPSPFKLTNVAIHLINTMLVFWFVTLLLRRHQKRLKNPLALPVTWIAVLVAAAWALHPLHLTSVLYVVQRMTSLSASFVLVGLIIFIHGRNRVQRASPHGFLWMYLGWAIGLTLGIASKENAALLLLFLPLIEYVFYQERASDFGLKKNLLRFYVLTTLLPLTLIVAWLIFQPSLILDSYQTRNFTIPQRLMTEARALWYYISLLFYPDIKEFSLYHDDFGISQSLVNPWTTLPACVSLILVGALGLIARSKYPILSFSILWYLAGHSMESSFIGLELVHEHRNYLPDIGPLMGLVYGVTYAFRMSAHRYTPIFLLMPLLLVYAVITDMRSHTWAEEEDIIQTMARNHPGSARAQSMMGELLAYRKHQRRDALTHYLIASDLAPEDTGALIRMATIAADTRIDLNPTWNSRSREGSPAKDDTYLQSSIAAKITTQLAESQISPTTLSALVSLSECFTHEPNACPGLYPDALTWYTAAINNPHNGQRERHSLVKLYFDSAFSQEDFEKILATIRDVKKDDPLYPPYDLMEANVYLKQNKLPEAEQILAEIATSPDRLSPDDMANLEILRSMLEKKKNSKPQ